MSYFKKTLIFIILIILYVLFILFNISGCGKDSNKPDNSYEVLQAFAAVQEETDPPVEIISDIISFSTIENSTLPTETETETEKQEDTDNIENTENTESPEIPDIPDNSEELYVITPSGKKYHYQTCRTVKTIKQYLTKEEAEQVGYEPCKICNPK